MYLINEMKMSVFNNIFQFLLVLNCMCSVFSSEKIVIIGAGASGIATATKLLENGFNNLIILEAECRIGGRIYTVPLNGTPIDLGAEWCDGQKGNIVYDKLEELDLLNMLRNEHFPVQFYTSSRSKNISYEFSKELANISKVVQEGIEESKDSLGDVFQKRYKQQISEQYKTKPEKLHIAQQANHYWAHLALRTSGSSSWYATASKDPDYQNKAGHSLGWKFGYISFLDVLMKKYPNTTHQSPIDDKIHLNKEVTKITYTNGAPVKIICSDKSIYTAKHVVVTTSLGVLKQRIESLFEPKLDENKIKAIKNIGFGAVFKAFVTFDKKWWGNLPGFNFIWTDEDRAASSSKFQRGPTNQQGESWIVDIFYIFAIPDSNILLCYFTGEMVPLLETMDELILKDGLHYTLNVFLGHLYDIPKPLSLLRSNWKSNPHFYGTNSFPSLVSTREDRRNLGTPILNSKGEPVIQFAGEATSVNHYSSVQGAIESGYIAADKIIELYKKNNV